MRPLLALSVTALFWALSMMCAAAAFADATGGQHDPAAMRHYKRGTELAEKGDHAGAIRAFEAAIRIEPQWLGVHNDLGVELYLLGQTERAVEELRSALRIDATQGAVHVNLAFALYDLGRVDDAVAEWRAALDRGTDVPDAYAGLALGLFKQGKTEEALKSYRRAIDRDAAYARLDHLGAGGAGWSPHAVTDAARLLSALEATTPAPRHDGPP